MWKQLELELECKWQEKLCHCSCHDLTKEAEPIHFCCNWCVDCWKPIARDKPCCNELVVV